MTRLDIVEADHQLCDDSGQARRAPDGYICIRSGCKRDGEYFVRDAGVLCARDAARRIRRRTECPVTRAYRVQFDRIGGLQDVAPLDISVRTVPARAADLLVERITEFVQLRAGRVFVVVDTDLHRGSLLDGQVSVGTFQVEALRGGEVRAGQ